MKVLKTGEMPNGTAIQLEDWREDYPTVWDTVSIAAYPIAKNADKWDWGRGGERFRLSINRGWKSNEEVQAAFDGLAAGTLTLEELADRFWDGIKAMWRLGMDVDYRP